MVDHISRRRIAGQLTVFGCWLCLTIAGLLLTPDPSGHGTHTQLGLPPCPSVLLFSRPCPGCGLTTSVSATLHGDLPFAFAAHPFGPPAYLLFTAYSIVAALKWLRRRQFALEGMWNTAVISLVLLFLAFGAYRSATTTGFVGGPEARYVKRLAGQS